MITCEYVSYLCTCRPDRMCAMRMSIEKRGMHTHSWEKSAPGASSRVLIKIKVHKIFVLE